ncbi:hypothetical protein L1987_26352 [Smallanthus sonchifolius]|uniref:Uncharacterized protein n=1 Tax=Smallanthus sonchifolius TaxID=185202 RepID=A0ACB9I9I4_9ASTR|nr:hypothetical protein L1987_26352 [Smallanthus sonchifolius]
MMKETELEEGEDRFDDNDANIDPDTVLSYIDDRLQYALGHFRKDFEHEMSAEILGPKFGGYGSFLPAYKHPPTVHSHGKALNSNKPSSPNNFHLEGAPSSLNPVTLVDPVKLAALHHKDVDDMASKDASLLHGETFLSKKETTTSNLVNPTEQRSLKVRIKVGSYNPAIKNDEIYGGLGLLTSSSSTSNNTEDSGDPLIESHDTPLDSPSSILHYMSSIFVPGNRLLSPLNESLICLKNKVTPLITGRIKSYSIVDDSLTLLGEVRQMEGKEVSPLDKKAGCEGDKAPYIEKGMSTEPVDCKQGLINDYKVKPSSDPITSEANRAAKKDVPPKIRETKKELIKDQLFGHESTSKESDEKREQKHVKKLSLDSRGIRLIVCKKDPGVIKHDTYGFEKKVGLKAINCEPHEVKIPNNMANQLRERKNKLTGIHRKENFRSSLSGAMKDKKSALKDIVKVRNSYKDILDTDNGAIKVESVERNAIPAEVAVPQQTVVGPAAPPDNWAGCDRCEKWRLLPIGIEPDNLPDKWLCSMSTWLPGRNNCDIGEDETTKAVQEMNLQLISQNQVSLQCNGSRGNTGHYDHKNINVHSETMANKFGKIKSRPHDGTSSSLIETSQASMDVQQHNRQKGKLLSETNQLLLEKKGDVKPKKLKNKTGSEQYETVTSKKIKTESEQLNASNGGHRPKDRLVVSVQTQTENNLLDKKVEIHAKKRKLRDWQESQPHANGLEDGENRIKGKEKRSKTEVKESSDDRCLNKGKTMKVKLSASKENSVDTNHEKNQQHRYKITCKKDLESEQVLHATTSSSSIVSGSCKRASLQETKESPVGSVLSSPIRSLNRDKISLAVGKTISRKAHVRTEIPRKDIDASQSQRIGGKVDLRHKEASKIRNSHNLEHTTEANNAIDRYERSNFQRVKVKASDPLTGQPNKMRRVEVDVSVKTINDGKIVGKKHAGLANMADMGSPEMNPTVKKNLKKVSVGDISKIRDSNEVEQVQAFDRSGQNRSKVMTQPGVAANQNAESLVTDCSTLKNLSVVSFLKEFASSQIETALTALKRAEESKDYADRLKISGFDYECNNAYFDSALKFLCAASLLEACTADIGKSKGVDVYTTSAELSKICAQEYEKRKEMFASALAYKCMEVACMRIVYCKNLLTRQDLQTSMQMVTQGESPSSSASDVVNLNNQATMDKTMLSKSITHHKNHIVVRNQANFTRLLDLTSDVSLAMEASVKSQNTYKSASAVLEEAQNKEMISTVKRVVNFSFQDVKEFACLVQNAREAVNRQSFKGNKRQAEL